LLAIYRQEFDYAIRMLERSLDKYIELAWQWPIAINKVYLGIARVQTGQYTDAEALFRSAMITLSERQALRELLHCIEGLCVTALHAGNSRRVVRLYGAVAGLQARLHIPALPLSEQFFVPHLTKVQQQLGEAQFMKHFAEGQRLTLDQALDEALRA
jgi:tetratricopeptide (TPR) repeat protein